MKNFQTYAEALEAVKQNGRKIIFVPKKFITYELCLAAIKQDRSATAFVPNYYNTDELIKLANENGKYIKYLSKTYDEALFLVKKDGLYLNRVIRYTPEFLTNEICLAAVKKDGRALECIKPEFQTEEICLEAIKSCGWWIIKYVVNQTKEFCLEAVKQNGMFLEYIKPEFQTIEICLEAINQNIDSHIFVKPELMYEVF